jgi:hypothetical protein
MLLRAQDSAGHELWRGGRVVQNPMAIPSKDQ